MGRVNNQNSGSLADLERRIRALETATPMNNAAVGRSGFEVYDGGTINVSNGRLNVDGTATINGVLKAEGAVTLSGDVRATGLPTTAARPNLYIDEFGRLKRSTAD